MTNGTLGLDYHGEATDAIDYALEGGNDAWTQETEFLRCWREGNLDDWPDFYRWLKARQRRRAA